MPKALKNLDAKMLEKLKEKLTKRVNVSFSNNKSYTRVSHFIFDKTHCNLSPSTLRRIFQYDSPYRPTKSTMDLICQSLGYLGWEDFEIKEEQIREYDLLQLISVIQIGGIGSLEDIKIQIGKFVDSPYLFNLIDTIVDASILQKDVLLLGQLFDFPGVFDFRQDSLKKFFFPHNLVVKLNRAGLMQKLVTKYGASEKAREFLVEWYVDEDNLDGYYYDLLQEYSRHKRGMEARLFYNCLMYQWADKNNKPTMEWYEPIRDFVETEPVHPIPKARRLVILMIEAAPEKSMTKAFQSELRGFLSRLNEDDKIIAVLLMVRLLFSKQRGHLITTILSYLPNTEKFDKDIWTQININQLKIYQAYAMHVTGKTENAIKLLSDFDPVLVNNFIRNTILNDHQTVIQLTSIY